MRIKKQDFVNEDIEIDNNQFEECTFTRCKIIFRARAPVSFLNCKFIDADWQFLEAASLTTTFFRSITDMSGDYGRAMIVQSFPTIKDWLSDEAKAKLAQPRLTSHG